MIEIPITQDWTPYRSKSDSLQQVLFDRCKFLEQQILTKASQEKTLNINNFDSGIEIEKIIRESLEEVLPKKFKLTKGYVCDRDGKTSGEHDIVIFNELWFPYLNGNSKNDGRKYFPIEGIYALGEVKQTLDISSLDEGMKKLVISQRLNRPRVGSNRYTENRKQGGHELGLANSLFTFLIATNYDDKIGFDTLFNRFFEINKSLYKDEMVRSLCVLNKFSISWAVFNESTNQYDMCLFDSKDEDKPVIPALRDGSKDHESSFYDLVFYLGAHLNSSILGSEDIYVAYGNNNYNIKVPPEDQYTVHNY